MVSHMNNKLRPGTESLEEHRLQRLEEIKKGNTVSFKSHDSHALRTSAAAIIALLRMLRDHLLSRHVSLLVT